MITYKSNGVNAQYTGGAVVIKDAADALHFFEASGEKTIGISGPLRVAADAGTATYTVTGAGSLGSIFTWSVEGGGGLTWSISSGGVLTIPSGVAAGTTASIMLKFGDMIVAGQQIVIEAAAPVARTLSISTTHATVTVKRGGTNITAETAIYDGDVLTISAYAEANYQNPTISVNGSSFTSGDTHTVRGDVTISATAEAVPDEPVGDAVLEFDMVRTDGYFSKTTFDFGIIAPLIGTSNTDLLSTRLTTDTDYLDKFGVTVSNVTGTVGTGNPKYVVAVKNGGPDTTRTTKFGATGIDSENTFTNLYADNTNNKVTQVLVENGKIGVYLGSGRIETGVQMHVKIGWGDYSE